MNAAAPTARMSVTDPTAFDDPVKRALDAGIPVVAYNADAPSGSKNLRQDLLAILERDSPEIVAVDVDEIENVVQNRNVAAGANPASMLANARALLHQAEGCAPLLVEGNDFAVQNGGFGFNKLWEVVQFRILTS